MKSELRKILEAFISDSTFYGEVGPEVVEAENQAVDAILELFNKQLPEKMPLVNDRYLKGFNQCLADIRRAAGLEE